jgi:Tfp pilus assembly protein FimT
MVRRFGAHRWPPRVARRGARGITLIELMVELAVVAVLL